MPDQRSDTSGNVNQRMPVRSARFDQYDLVNATFAQPVGKQATSRTGANNHIVGPSRVGCPNR